MTQSNYKEAKIEKSIFPFVYKVLENNVIKECFNKNMWIAGGLSRKIGRIVLGLDKHDKSSYKDILKYFKQNGDIDFFTDNVSNINYVYNKVEKNYFNFEEFDWSLNIESKLRSKNLRDPDFPWLSPFANNIDLKRLNATIQLVNKFNFNSIEECLDSFDLLNCKYAIYRKGSNYFLVYDNDLKYESDLSLALCHSKTPFLGNRIVKYMKKYNMTFANTAKNMNIFEDYLYMMSANVWKEEVGIEVDDLIIGSTIKRLNDISKLSPQHLSLFIGKISGNVAVKSQNVSNSYSVYSLTIYKNVDWAANEIIKRANFV
jgi:hypothetical protein